MPDGEYKHAVELVADVIDHRLTRCLVGGVDSYLDEFVMGNRVFDFIKHGLRQAGGTDDYHRFAMVRQAA